MKLFMHLFILLLIVTFVAAVPTMAQAKVNLGAPNYESGSVLKLTRDVYQAAKIPETPAPSKPNTNTNLNIGSSNLPVQQVQPTEPVPPPPTAAKRNFVQIGSASRDGSVISLKSVPQPTAVTAQRQTEPKQSTSTTVPDEAAQLTPDEQTMVDLINQERLNAGLHPVAVDIRLVNVARLKANDMKDNNYFGHISPVYGSPFAMMQEQGLYVRWGSENIDANRSVAGAMAAFMFSPAHRANILDPKVTHVGIGIAYNSSFGNIYVQEFLQE